MKKSSKLTVYEPNRSLKMGIGVWREMFSDLQRGRELIWRLFIRNLISKNKQSVLGYLWLFIMPLFAVGTFVFLNRSGIVNVGEVGMPYPLYALIGLTLWQLFSVGVASGSESLVSASSLISKVNFPREVLVLSSIADTIFEFLVKCIFIAVLFVYFGIKPSWTVILFPLLILPILFLSLGVSLLLSLVNGVLRDTGNIISLTLNFLMFLTPVFYPLSSRGENFLFFEINPLSSLINGPRNLVVFGKMQSPEIFGVFTVLSFLLFFISWRVFHLSVEKIPERL